MVLFRRGRALTLAALLVMFAMFAGRGASADEPRTDPSLGPRAAQEAAPPAEPSPEPSSAAPSPEPAPPPEPPPPPPPPPSSKVFNPDIAVIGSFRGALGRNDSEFATPGLELHEVEASFQAIVDPFARADFFLAFSDDEVGVEEGFITFTSLPANLLLKVGRMRASFGKVNPMHVHVLPWTDRPLVTQDLLGGEEGLADAGLSLSRLFPNDVLFLEAIAEVFRGENEVFAAPRRRDVTLVGRLRGYRDVTESTNLDFGVSFARGQAAVGESLPGTEAEPAGAAPATVAGRRLWGVDLTLRWRPLRRAIYKRFHLRTEAVWSRPGEPFDDRRAFGGYVAAEYQVGRRWFAAARLDRAERAPAPDLVDKGGSLLLTYRPSEFSHVRGQYRHTRYGGAITANELLFQFQFSIGAHGAHTF